MAEAATQCTKTAAGLVGLALLLLVNLAGWPGFWHGFLVELDKPYVKVAEPIHRAEVARLRNSGFGHFYGAIASQTIFLAAGRPVIADPWRESRSFAATAVDASLNPAWSMDGLEIYAHLLGLPFKRSPLGYAHAFAQPQGADQLIPQNKLSAKGLDGQDLGRVLFDRDQKSGQTIDGEPKRGHGFVIDLGETRPVGGVSLTPGDYAQTPSGLAIYTAGPDGKLSLLREARGFTAPFYLSGPHPFFKVRYPRMEVYFPPRSIRYLKVEHLGTGQPRHPVSFREVLLFGPGDPPAPAVDWQRAGERLLKAVRAAKPARVFADAWPSAYLRQNLPKDVWTLPANYATDDYGSLDPVPEKPLPLLVGPGSLLVAAKSTAEDVAASLGRWRVSFTSQKADAYVLFQLKGRTAPAALPLKSVTANVNQEQARALADPAHRGRWSSNGPQGPGVYLQIDLGRAQALGGVRLSCPDHPNDWARGLAAQVSDDGQNWRPAAFTAAGPLCFSGQVVMAAPGPQGADYVFTAPTKARFIRLSVSQGHKLWWWSVQRLVVLAP